MTRRSFLKRGAMAAVATQVPAAAFAGVKPELTFGVLSDLHIEGAHPSEKTAAFERALAYFREAGVDAVVITGDIADYGLVEELENAARSWYRVFPGDRMPDGRRVERIFVLGDHDTNSWKHKSVIWGGEWQGRDRERKYAASIARDPAAAWKKCFHEEYSQHFVKKVKGYDFLCAHWKDYVKDIPGAEEFILEKAPLADRNKPFFYIQHRHPKGTCYSPWAPSDGGRVTPVLARFPNAVAISGHAHEPLSDERNIWQGAFTSIGAATLDYAGGRNWCENCAPHVQGTSIYAPMPTIDWHLCTQGQIFRVYADRIEIERRDFQWGESMGPDWVVPWPPEKGRPFAAGVQAAKAGTPAFPADAAAEFVETDGFMANYESMRKVVVSFPAADAGPERVYHYEVVAQLNVEDFTRPYSSKLILAPDYHLPPSRSHLGGEAYFALCELPREGAVRFIVTPVSCFGKRGKSIESVKTWSRGGK